MFSIRYPIHTPHTEHDIVFLMYFPPLNLTFHFHSFHSFRIRKNLNHFSRVDPSSYMPLWDWDIFFIVVVFVYRNHFWNIGGQRVGIAGGVRGRRGTRTHSGHFGVLYFRKECIIYIHVPELFLVFAQKLL